MRAEEMRKLKVMELLKGTTIGSVTGLLIDGDKRQIAALEVGGGMLSSPDYLPFKDIKSIENDVLTISSPAVVVASGEFDTYKLIGNLSGLQVFSEDGKNLGTVHDYDVDTQNGEITFITVAKDTAVMGGLWQSAGERFDIPRSQIATLGESILVTAQLQTKYSNHQSNDGITVTTAVPSAKHMGR